MFEPEPITFGDGKPLPAQVMIASRSWRRNMSLYLGRKVMFRLYVVVSLVVLDQRLIRKLALVMYWGLYMQLNWNHVVFPCISINNIFWFVRVCVTTWYPT